MYLYLYDHFLNAAQYHRSLSRIEMRLTDLGIGGKIIRLSPLKNIKDLVSDEVRFGVKTIVAVGNDETVTHVINNIAEYDAITFGIIPVGKGNVIARDLGIPDEELACDVISARRVEKIDLGRINATYFISGLSIELENQVELYCENSYSIIPQSTPCTVSICNLRPENTGPEHGPGVFNPQDGMLEAFIRPTGEPAARFFNFIKKGQAVGTIIPFKKISVQSKKSVTIVTDGKKILKPPVEIQVVPKKLSVIVGKDRRL